MSPVIKPKGEKFTLPGKYLLFILTVLCTGLMVLTFTTSALSTPLSYAAGFLVVPFEKGLSKVGSYLNERTEMLQEIQHLIEENESLKQQVADLTGENISLQQDRFELTNLRQLYQLDAEYADYEKVGARVISKDSGNWYHAFVIDKGTDDGIEENMNVIAGAGLVGRVTSTGKNWAKVTTIISDNVSASGTVLSTSDNIVVTGNLETYADGLIEFSKLIDEKDQVVEGDKIVTSNISDHYLPGILIGYISRLNTDSNNLTKSGYLTPAVDFSHLEEVLVILEQKQTIGD